MAQTDRLASVEVTLQDDSIQMPETIQAGQNDFVVTNRGKKEHNLQIEGHGLRESFEQPLQPGETRTMRIELPPGSYNVRCPLSDHDYKEAPVHLQVRDPRRALD